MSCEGFWRQDHDWSKWEKITLTQVKPGSSEWNPTQLIYQERRCQRCGLYQLRRYED